MGVRRISPAKLVEDIYMRGRSYREFVGFEGSTQKSIPSPEWETDPRGNSSLPQRREDSRADGYDNDVGKNWLRGYGGKMDPHFDDSDPSGPPTRKK